MKKGTRMISLLLALSLLVLTACGDANNSKTPLKGRFVEVEITPPEGKNLGGAFVLEDESLVVYETDFSKKWVSTDAGKTWEEKEVPSSDEVDLSSAQGHTVAPDGTLYAIVGMENPALYKVSADGKIEKLPLAGFDEKSATGEVGYIQTMKVPSNNRLLLGYMTGNMNTTEGGMSSMGNSEMLNHLYDLETGEVIGNTPGMMMDMCSDDKSYYVMEFEGEITKYSLEDGKETAKMGKFEFDMQNSHQMKLSVDANGTLYLATSMGVQSLSADSKERKEFMNASSFGTFSRWANSFSVLKDETLVLSIMEEEGSSLYTYKWDAEAIIDPDKSLKIWSLFDNASARSAMSTLQKKYPEGMFELEIGAANDETIAVQDALFSLNTRLVADDAPDIIMLDGCPVESYTTQGLLLNLKDIVDTSDMYDTIKNSAEVDGKMYYLPTRFSVPLIVGGSKSLAKVDTMEKLVDEIKNGKESAAPNEMEDPFAPIEESKRPTMSFESLQSAFDLLLKSSISSVIKDNTVDSKQTLQFLNSLKEISDKYELGKNAGSGGGGAGMVGSAMAIAVGGGDIVDIPMSLTDYSMQRSLYGAFNATSFLQLIQALSVPGSELAILPGLEQGAWQGVSKVGINASTKSPEFAAEFVQAMLGEEIQGSMVGGGMPVTKAGAERQVKLLSDMNSEGEMDIKSSMDKIIAKLGSESKVDGIVSEKLYDAAIRFCKGEITAEKAVEKFESDIKNYLAEKQ